SSALYTAEFRRGLEDSDFLHWGEGTVYVHDDRVAFEGALAPGPDYRLYFSPQWVETEQDFLRLKSTMVEAGDVKTFENFMVSLPPGLDPGEFNTVVVWCESFRQFITAGQYR
ncbi:MAG: DM13 domain-containing protein, partial [Xanthomonadales bacterium]|nr:DM13 domain-containing protein [Xanthomonadales bacterium]